MNCIDNNKPVYVINCYNLFYGVLNSNKSLVEESIYPYTYKSGFLSFSSHDKEFDALKNKEIAAPAGGTLFFASNSKFPRTKLAETPYKRCIKPEKAQYYVYNFPTSKYTTIMARHLYETDKAYYIMQDDQYYMERIAEFMKMKKDPKKALNDFVTTYAPFASVEDEGMFIATYEKKPFYLLDELAWNVINDPILSKLSYISDVTLDKAVSKKMEAIDLDALLSFDDMLKSPDEEVVATAMRLITNYDTATYPLALRALFMMNNRAVRTCSAWNSTAIKQLRKSLDLDEVISSRNDNRTLPYCIQGVKGTNKKWEKDDVDMGYNLVMNRMNLWEAELRKKQVEVCKKYNITPVFDD